MKSSIILRKAPMKFINHFEKSANEIHRTFWHNECCTTCAISSFLKVFFSWPTVTTHFPPFSDCQDGIGRMSKSNILKKD